MISADDTSLMAILAASVAASDRMMSVTVHPQDLRDGEAAVDGIGRLVEHLTLGQARHGLVRAGDVDVLERIVGGLHTGDVDGLDLADVGQDGVELAGETVQLGFGQCQPGKPGEVGNLVAGDLGHDRKA